MEKTDRTAWLNATSTTIEELFTIHNDASMPHTINLSTCDYQRHTRAAKSWWPAVKMQSWGYWKQCFQPHVKDRCKHNNYWQNGWLGSQVVSMLDSDAEGSQPLCLCSPSSKIGSSPLKGCGDNCRPGRMAAYHRVYDSRHLQADCQEPGSPPEAYAR